MDWIAYGLDENDVEWEFTSEDGGAGDVPPFGVIVIAQRDTHVGRVLNWNPDKGYFVYVPQHGEWDCKDFVGLIDALAHFPGTIVRFGRGVPTRIFQAVMQRAMADERLPRKSAWKRDEMRPPGA